MRTEQLGLVAAVVLGLPAAACNGDESSAQGSSGGAGGAGATSSGGATSTTSHGGAGAGGSGQGGSPSSSGCGKSSPVGTQALSIDVGGSARTYVLSVPASYQPLTPLGLVFAWHGRGGNGAGAKAYFGVEQQAAGAAIFVYPDGLLIDGQTGWDLNVTGVDVAFFDALRAQVEADYCIDLAREFSTGHSFGGYMSNTLGCARGNVLRAIAPVAGGGPWGSCDPTPLSAFVVHGSNDPVVDPSEGQASLEYWRTHASCSDTSQPVAPAGCVEYQGCSGARVVFCSHDEQHNWPALAPAGVWGFFASL